MFQHPKKCESSDRSRWVFRLDKPLLPVYFEKKSTMNFRVHDTLHCILLHKRESEIYMHFQCRILLTLNAPNYENVP